MDRMWSTAPNKWRARSEVGPMGVETRGEGAVREATRDDECRRRRKCRPSTLDPGDSGDNGDSGNDLAAAGVDIEKRGGFSCSTLSARAQADLCKARRTLLS
mmetsp:Transcript_20107/g.41282  ORF Transcript_20107/g.41282 Transcript_20107/m.41282 type:complete len:102 (-) Transcript_20107:238-543(-)